MNPPLCRHATLPLACHQSRDIVASGRNPLLGRPSAEQQTWAPAEVFKSARGPFLLAVNEPNPAICDSCQPLADATVVPAPVMIVPTIYPSDPAAPIVVHNYMTINVQAAGFREICCQSRCASSPFAAVERDCRRNKRSTGSRNYGGPNNTNGTEPDRNLIDVLLVRPLRYLADKAGSAVIGSLAAKILEWLLNL